MTKRKKPTEREIVAIVARQFNVWDHPGGAIFGIQCPICKAPISQAQIPEAERDHIQPLGLGGTDTPDNMAFVHGHCHREKSGKDWSSMAEADRMGGGRGSQRARRERRKEMDKILEEQGERTRFSRLKSRPMPGTKASGIRKRFDGTTERRET